MQKTFNQILKDGALPPFWSEATLIPIVKPDKDPSSCVSYRPIALINVDAKIFTSILATRLQNIIEEYIHVEQTGFIPNQSMTDNVQKV